MVHCNMVTVDIKNLEKASDDLAQFIKHLQEHFEEINKDYAVEISITEEDYDQLPGSQIPVGTKGNPDIKETGVQVSINFDSETPDNITSEAAKSFYDVGNFVLLGSYRGSEGKKDSYVFETKQ